LKKEELIMIRHHAVAMQRLIFAVLMTTAVICIMGFMSVSIFSNSAFGA